MQLARVLAGCGRGYLATKLHWTRTVAPTPRIVQGKPQTRAVVWLKLGSIVNGSS